jgi:hypothetical protein
MTRIPVEVVSVQAMYHPSTKEKLTQVQFGEFSHQEQVDQPIGATINLVVFLKATECPQYKVGSKWAIVVGEFGELKLDPLMQPETLESAKN